ncbi:MAG: M23 family metallopeptidase [Syntrophomonadaceae bacterium]|nr:M23 family metallopeptidase [Syntrophomonadaceae bacterium]
MRQLVRCCTYAKFLGLLGLGGLFFTSPLWDYLWLLWLLGLVEIAYNFPVFVQSLQMVGGMVKVPLRYGSQRPGINNFQGKVNYALPFSGRWTVVNGGVDKQWSHSWSIPSQRYAYDFLILDPKGRSYRGPVTEPGSYYCYGQDILAPADGEVVAVGKGHPDSHIAGRGRVDCAARDIRGNHIILRHHPQEYSLLAHLQPGSIAVSVGDRVRRGQKLARCGNSGNSSEPHLHFQVQDGTSLFYSAGLPVRFEAITVEAPPRYAAYDPRPLPPGPPDDKYIRRGQSVAQREPAAGSGGQDGSG